MSQLSPKQYLEALKEILLEKGDPMTAEGQMNYMKNRFAYYGLKAPVWSAIAKQFFKEHGIFQGEQLESYLELSFEEDYREVHYIGLEMLQKAQKKEGEDYIYLLEKYILEKSWWDSVDWISKMVSLYFKKYPHQIIPVTEKWIESDNIWLIRSAIIFQRYKNYPTDWEMLKRYILKHAYSSEFFIQKAAGWALRDHSKIDPQAVLDFVQAHPELSSLTKREALRKINL